MATSLAIIVGERADSAEIARSAQAIAHLVFAAVDGIELHYDMDPAGYPLDEVFELLLGFVLAETRRLTGGWQTWSGHPMNVESIVNHLGPWDSIQA